jgi:hypothetical protein
MCGLILKLGPPRETGGLEGLEGKGPKPSRLYGATRPLNRGIGLPVYPPLFRVGREINPGIERKPLEEIEGGFQIAEGSSERSPALVSRIYPIERYFRSLAEKISHGLILSSLAPGVSTSREPSGERRVRDELPSPS